MKKKLLKINDPIHGFIIFPDFITMIVDSKEIQRLTRIRQLSGANYVFPGANHTRFAHSLGVAALAQRLARNLIDIHDVDLDEEDINDCIVAALCHDVGHGPFSHNFESLLLEYTNKDHEDYTEWIIKDSELGDRITELGFKKSYIAEIATGKIIGKGNLKGSILSQIITSAINVDSMDYLLRDNYHCGTEGRSIDINRLMLGIDTVEGGMLGIDMNALIALEGFLLSRLSSFRTIYFHKTCRAVQLMLGEAMRLVVNDIGLLDYKTTDDYNKWDDYILWGELLRHPKSAPIIEQLKRRELLKMCYESKIEISQKEPDPKEVIQQLAAESQVPESDIYIDLPSSPNVPYSHFDETRSNEVIAFKRVEDEKIPVHLEEYSLFFNQFKGHLKLVRVYTRQNYRKELAIAARKVLGEPNERTFI